MKWFQKPVRRAAVVVICAAILVIGGMLIARQRADLSTLETYLQTVKARRSVLLYKESEMQQELNISNSSDYIAARARENGYIMPNEIRFVIKNPAALSSYETMEDAELAIETPAEPSAAEPAAEPAEEAPAAEEATEEGQE